MFVLDTNVLSELLKGDSRCDWGVRRWFDQTPLEELYLSVIVLGEIRKGAELIRRRDPARTAHLERWLRELRQVYRRRILSITEDVSDIWKRLAATTPFL
jgi:predicted nucleic acid-binding protein